MGTAADADLLSDSRYTSVLRSEYSELEPENEMKFDSIHPAPERFSFSAADALVAFAEANSMKVRGHNLLWYQQLPGWIVSPSSPWSPAALNKVLAGHIAAVVGHYKGHVYAWDVVNEPFNDDGSMRSSVWYDKPGIGYAEQGTKMIEQALRWAHAADPAARLFVNETGAEGFNAKYFVRRGVPLSGIGIELHVGIGFDQPDSLDDLQANVKRIAALGLEVQFTEVDVEMPHNDSFSLSQEASVYKDLLDICVRQPQCTLFQTWGFTDAHSWRTESNGPRGWPLPFDRNYRKKPAYHAMLKRLEGRGYDGPRPIHAR
jgi:endo-1,4-beta-xylanase